MKIPTHGVRALLRLSCWRVRRGPFGACAVWARAILKAREVSAQNVDVPENPARPAIAGGDEVHGSGAAAGRVEPCVWCFSRYTLPAVSRE